MKIIVSWLPAFLWAMLIFYLSSKPGLKVADGFWDFATRKPAHIFIYFTLYLLVYFAFAKTTSITRKRILQFAFILTIFYAITDEIHQSFVPLREGKISDIIWDAIGAFAAVIIIWKYFQNLPKTLKIWLSN